MSTVPPASKRRLPTAPSLLRSLLFFLLGLVLLGALIVWNQERLIFPGVNSPKSVGAFALLPGVRAVRFSTVDGESLQGFTTIEQSGGSGYVGLIFHGNGESAEAQNFLPFFRKVGIPALTFDYRGYGRSTGWPSEEGIYRDAEAAAEEVRKLSGVEFGRFVLLGNSIGSGPAAYLASKIKPHALLILAGYADFRDLVESKPLYGLLTPFLRYRFPVTSYLEELSSQCVVLAHGERDQTIPFENLRALRSAVPRTVRLSVLDSPEASHNDIFYKVEEQLIAKTRECLGW